ncbi:unnamed protein product [Ranitomeya imitator]|uniref:Exportin-5 C-terminal domain-containing protein n=1 Tax=Ranitomeya imitator TaxID=111125 RepID=A0ABN9LJR0_9NEOB|nr:unnamed protein product [Ranitomeya imitator]
MGDFYVKCLDMLDVEKKCILGTMQPLLDAYDSPVYKTVQERMQGFLCSLHDCWCQILGNLGPSLREDFYSIPGLAIRLVNSAFCNLNNLPDFRLRPMLHILSLGEKDFMELNTETTEILEVELVRLLTREMVDLIVVSCIAKKTSDTSSASTGVEDVRSVAQGDAEEEEMSVDVAAAGSLELTELGKLLISQEGKKCAGKAKNKECALCGRPLPDAYLKRLCQSCVRRTCEGTFREIIRREVKDSLKSLSQREPSKRRREPSVSDSSTAPRKEYDSEASISSASSSEEDANRFCFPLDQIDRLVKSVRSAMGVAYEKQELSAQDLMFGGLDPRKRKSFPLNDRVQNLVKREWKKPEKRVPTTGL